MQAVNREGPDPIDVAVGARVRIRRRWLGLSQTQLANALGITFQQVQKYERGANRVSASMLVKIAAKLETTVAALVGEDGSAPVEAIIYAQLATPGGTRFRVIGLHPRPPAPGQDTDARDAEIAIAARHAAEAPQPTLSIGDFNDVAWSHTSQMFKRIGGYLDPRVGRGRYPTFPAGWPMLRWPLDHVFLSPEFVVISMRVLRNVGSDHLPVSVRLCLAPHVAPVVNEEPVPADAEDFAETREIIEDYKAGD